MGSAAFHTELNSLCELDGEKSSHGPPSLSQELRGIDAANGISPKKKSNREREQRPSGSNLLGLLKKLIGCRPSWAFFLKV